MPFKSQAQRRWMYANHPKMAKKWEKHTPKGKKLPKKVKKKKKAKKESFARLIDQALQILFEEETEIQVGQSSKRTKNGASVGVNKGSNLKHKRQPKKKSQKSNG